jgi:hypothetical protein
MGNKEPIRRRERYMGAHREVPARRLDRAHRLNGQVAGTIGNHATGVAATAAGPHVSGRLGSDRNHALGIATGGCERPSVCPDDDRGRR